jgi:hypothetical protein
MHIRPINVSWVPGCQGGWVSGRGLSGGIDWSQAGLWGFGSLGRPGRLNACMLLPDSSWEEEDQSAQAKTALRTRLNMTLYSRLKVGLHPWRLAH